MKTSLAIATAVLMFSAILSLTSGVAAQNYGNLSGKSPGVSPVQIPVLLPSPPGPGPYRGNR